MRSSNIYVNIIIKNTKINASKLGISLIHK